MKKIVFFILDISKSGGTERVVCNLANLLAEIKNIRVTIISLNSSQSKTAFAVSSNVHVLFLHFNFNSQNIKRLLAYWKVYVFFHRLDQKKTFDIAIGTTHMINSILALAVKRIKTIGCEHIPYEVVPAFSRLLRRICYPFLDRVIVLSLSTLKSYSFLVPGKAIAIPNPLSFESKTKAALHNKVIIAIGRLSFEKSYERLIHIGAELKKKLPDWKIEIWGAGPDHDKLQQQIVEEDVEDYVFLKGNTNCVIEKMLSASICVMTSIYEAQPMALLEAQECGLPLVAYNCGTTGPCNIIQDGYNGFLIPNGDSKQFIEKVCCLTNDIDLRLTMGKNGTECAKMYSGTVIREKWLQLFDSLLKKE